jgi:hypothetical protein
LHPVVPEPNHRLTALNSEIPATLKNHSTMRIVAHDSDVRLYIRRELHRKGVSEFADEQFIEELVQRLSAGADGM